MKKAVKVLLILALAGTAGYFGYQYYLTTQTSESYVSASAENAYQQVTIGKGSLSKTVTGTGSLGISKTEDVALSYAVTITGTAVSVGDKVTSGQALLDIDQEALQTTLDTLQSELDTCESDMASISNNYSTTTYLTTPVTGVVKEVYVSPGQTLQDVMQEKGAIALLSLDGKMYVEIDAVEGMQVTTQVKVKVGNSNLDGVVREINAGKARITFTDTVAAQGQEVEVIYQKESLGTATAYINLPYQLTATEKGYVSYVYMEPNQKKWKGNRTLYLINVPVSDEYATLLSKREKLTRQIAEAKAILASGTIDSPIDGIVSTLVEATNTEQTAQTILASLYVGNQKEMVVTVDELDIIHLQVGQSAVIQMDAVSEQIYTGSVSHVSQVGTSESGVTVYEVTIDLDTDGNDPLLIGMNGTANIMVQQVNDVLLVPISALNTSRDGQYVWVQNPDPSEGSDDPGIKTFVTTGMSNENFAQVLTGLSEGDVVLVTREANTDITRRFVNSMGGGDVMFAMPVGGGNAPGGAGGTGRPGVGN